MCDLVLSNYSNGEKTTTPSRAVIKEGKMYDKCEADYDVLGRSQLLSNDYVASRVRQVSAVETQLPRGPSVRMFL